MYRTVDPVEIMLPAGTYYLEYEVDDIFMRPHIFERIEMHWDGEKLTFPDNFSWSGEVVENQ